MYEKRHVIQIMDDGHNKNDSSKNITRIFPKVKITLTSTNKIRCVHSN
jgi:hypothetical protein